MIHGNDFMSCVHVFEWHKIQVFNDARENVEINERSGRSVRFAELKKS